MGQSAQLPVFELTAEDLATKLEDEGGGSSESLELARQARHLLGLFHGWRDVRPGDGERTQAVTALVDLNRRAQEFLAGQRAK
jgi:hypothetical protein